MEEVQSWWEVPTIAHFCYAFRSAFNLFYFEIAELESALLNIQDPDMSISLEQLIMKILQGCYDEESVNDENWEEKLHELFEENVEDDENPLNNSSYFVQLTPRSKVEILLKLCELRLDVEGAIEEIKNIPSEDMQAKCIGKDSRNNTYWYFYDERLYKEDTSISWNKAKQFLKNKNAKNTSNKKPTSTREKRTKANQDIDRSWKIECFNISDWEKVLKQFTTSRNSQEKELVTSIKNHLPLLQEKVAEKDRMLRKRFLELAPKRSSSRISRVQEKKKIEELKAAEKARKAQLGAEKKRAKEEAKKEAKMLKMKQESRQRRAEERHKAIEERAERAKLWELSRNEDSDESENEEEDDDDEEDSDVPSNNRNVLLSRTQRTRRKIKKRYEESENKESDDNVSEDEFPSRSQNCSRSTERTKFDSESTQLDNKRYGRTYSNYNQQSRNNELRVSARHQNNPKSMKYQFDSDKSEQESDTVYTPDVDKANSRHPHSSQNIQGKLSSEESDNENSSDIPKVSSNDIKCDIKKNSVKTEDSVSKQDSINLPNHCSSWTQDANSRKSSPKVTMYKTSVLQNSSDVSKWNSAINPKGQKLRILHRSFNNLASKKPKLEQVKNYRTISSGVKSSMLKENHIYKPVQTAFITYGKIIPSPAIVKLQYRKPNPQVSS